MARKKQASLKEIVGDKVYSVWIDMLHRLVPDGRTHRLATTIASMLTFASDLADEKYGNDPTEGSVGDLLQMASDGADPDEARALLLPVVERLFRDAKVRFKRTSSRGQKYSIAEDAVQEFLEWYNMPWER